VPGGLATWAYLQLSDFAEPLEVCVSRGGDPIECPDDGLGAAEVLLTAGNIVLLLAPIVVAIHLLRRAGRPH
jgi:hypothetical protein